MSAARNHVSMTRIAGCLAAVLLPLFMTACGESVTLPATGTVYGELVYADGTPAAGLLVLVEGAGLSDVTDKQGRFVIGGVLAVDRAGMGKYYTIRGYGDRGTAPMGFLIDHFKVKGQQSYSVGTVTVYETGSITGVIQLEGQTDHSGVYVGIEGTSIQTITRADGSYVLDRVPMHEGYRLPCHREGFLEMTIDVMDVNGTPAPIKVDPGQVTDLGSATLQAQP